MSPILNLSLFFVFIMCFCLGCSLCFFLNFFKLLSHGYLFWLWSRLCSTSSSLICCPTVFSWMVSALCIPCYSFFFLIIMHSFVLVLDSRLCWTSSSVLNPVRMWFNSCCGFRPSNHHRTIHRIAGIVLFAGILFSPFELFVANEKKTRRLEDRQKNPSHLFSSPISAIIVRFQRSKQ